MPGFSIPLESEDICDGAGGGPPGVTKGPDYAMETNRKHRYLWEIFGNNNSTGSSTPSDDWESLLVYAYKSGRPSIEFDEITIHSGQDEIYRPGKSRWKPVEISFYEVVDGNKGKMKSKVGEAIYEWWSNTMLNIITSSFHKPIDYLKPCVLAMLDGAGNATWRYELCDCWPQRVTPSDLSYVETEIADITVTLRFDKAVERSTP